MTKLPRNAILLIAAVLLGGCNIGEPPPFNPRTLQQSERQSARHDEMRRMAPLPTTLQSPFLNQNGAPAATPTTLGSMATTGPSLGIEPQVRLSLQEIIHRAVANSLDVKVASYQPAIDQTRVTEADARFDPTYFANLQFERRDRKLAFPTAGT